MHVIANVLDGSRRCPRPRRRPRSEALWRCADAGA